MESNQSQPIDKAELVSRLAPLNKILGHEAYRARWENWTLIVTTYTNKDKHSGKFEFQMPHDLKRYERFLSGKADRLTAHMKGRNNRQRPESERRTHPMSTKVPQNVHEWLIKTAEETGKSLSEVAAEILEKAYKEK